MVEETWNTCPDCGKRWADDTPTPGVVHRARRCARCVTEHKIDLAADARQQVIDAAEARGAAARQAEIVEWLRREAVGGALGPAALLSWAADQIEGGIRLLTPDEQAWCDYAAKRKDRLSIAPSEEAESLTSFRDGIANERARAVKLAEDYLEQLAQAGKEAWSIALREFIRRLKEEAR